MVGGPALGREDRGARHRRCVRLRQGRRPFPSETRRARRRADREPRPRCAVRRRAIRAAAHRIAADNVRRGAIGRGGEESARIQAFAYSIRSGRVDRYSTCAIEAPGVGNERISVHVGIGFGRPSGQGRGPDFRRGARRDSRAGPDGRVAAETLVSTGLVVMAGEITTNANVDYGARRARDDPRASATTTPSSLRRRRLRRDGLLRQAVARHRAGRRPARRTTT